ncbi:MAG: folate hydrolase, partial [Acidobacteriota bacterium]
MLAATGILAQAQNPIKGFAPAAWPAEHELEQQAQALPEATYLHTYMEKMASAPHHAGSPGSKAVADYLLKLMKSWDLDARIESFEALLPYPTIRLV